VGHNDEVACPANDAVCEAQIQDFAAQFGTPFGGRVTVEEGYVETNLPLLKDRSGAHLLEVDIAGRESRYTNKALYGYDVQNGVLPEASHNLTTWKVSGFYDPVEGVRFRGSQSRDSRAANFRELYYGQVLASGATGGFGYCNHPTSANIFDDPCTENLIGNVNLRPETSDTTTLGLVLTPTSLPGLQFSADWFHIRLKNAITAANTLQVELSCTQGNAQSCSQMQFNPNSYLNGNIVQPGTPGALTGAAAWQAGVDNAANVTASAFNGAFYDTRGVDFSLNYTQRLPDGSTLSARALTTWTSEQIYQGYPGGPVFSILGQTGAGTLLSDYNPAPRWRGNLAITWLKGGLSLTPMMNWVGRGTLSYLGVTPQQTDLYNKVANNDPSIRGYGYQLLPFNSVPSYFVFNMNGTYGFENLGPLKGLQLWVQVNNVLNRQPPFAGNPAFFGNAYAGTNPLYFDTIGLAWRAGFRLSF
jgi:iron complex outermembrane recepter protein